MLVYDYPEFTGIFFLPLLYKFLCSFAKLTLLQGHGIIWHTTFYKKHFNKKAKLKDFKWIICEVEIKMCEMCVEGFGVKVTFESCVEVCPQLWWLGISKYPPHA